MFTAAFHTSRHYILFTAMACLCVLLGGPSYAAGAESLIIAGATYYEPGVSGPGWAWTDADHLELSGLSGEAIGADGDLVVTLIGKNSVKEMQSSIVDISQCGMEVWGNLTLRGTGSLTATGSQCGIHAFQALVVDGCTVNAQADGAGIEDEVVAGLVAGRLAVRGCGRVVAAGAGSGAGARLRRVPARRGPRRWRALRDACRRRLVARCDRRRRRRWLPGRIAYVRALCGARRWGLWG